jgi:hypothetical protein
MRLVDGNEASWRRVGTLLVLEYGAVAVTAVLIRARVRRDHGTSTS